MISLPSPTRLFHACSRPLPLSTVHFHGPVQKIRWFCSVILALQVY